MATGVHPEQCNNLKINGFAVMKGRPCKIVEMSKSKPGKHGAAKIHMVGIDIFTAKKYDEICPSTHPMEVPDVTRLEQVLIDISSDDYLSLMSEDGKDQRTDLKLPQNDIGKKIREQFDEGRSLQVTVQGAMGEESVIAFKECKAF